MKILATPTSFLKSENEKARKLLEEFADEVVYNTTGKPLAGDELLSLLDGADGYIAGVDYITENVIKKMPANVKVISRYGAGIDRVDIKACKDRGITVTNTPGANATAVCELAFGLMLAAVRGIPQLHNQVEAGQWPRANGMELAGKTLGIIGLGAIGKKLAKRAKAFDMKIAAFDPYIDKAFADAEDIDVLELDELLKISNVISLHVPLTPETKHMISRDRIALMPKGAIIINTARGGLVDEQAAAEALKNGHIRGLGLDAFEEEPLVNSPLKGLDGVVFTPHAGAHTAEAVENMGIMAVKNVIAVLMGEQCPYIIK